MLSQFEKINLDQLFNRYNLDYLTAPLEVYDIQIPEQQYFTDLDTDNPRRKIFYRVPYDRRELNMISDIRAQLQIHHIHQKISDELILKHIYASNFQKQKTIQRLTDVINYHRHPVITQFTQNTLNKLNSGIVYTYGCDRKMRPVVVIRLDKINFEENFDSLLNAYYFLMLVVYHFRMVPYHAEKVTFIADLGDLSFRKVPIFSLYDQMKKIGTYYCGLTERTLLYNASGLGWLWKVISNFLTETQKKKLVVIPKGQEKKALEYIDPLELEMKYGGKLANLTEYWPPQATHEAQEHAIRRSSSSEYQSIQNNQEFFTQTSQTSNCCCKCSIY